MFSDKTRYFYNSRSLGFNKKDCTKLALKKNIMKGEL